MDSVVGRWRSLLPSAVMSIGLIQLVESQWEKEAASLLGVYLLSGSSGHFDAPTNPGRFINNRGSSIHAAVELFFRYL